MAFPLPLIRFTARRTGEGDLPLLYPRLLRDAAMLPKIDIAAAYFESMVGRERREMDAEVLVQFFADHKLARCMVLCLARTYRFRAPALAEVVTKVALRRLERLGLTSPVALRLRLFDDVNARASGFLDEETREPAVTHLEHDLRLRPGELQTLLRLDAPEHATLVRVGEPPRSEDVAAQYNVGVLETLLRHAVQVDLTFTGAGPGDTGGPQRVREVCAAHGVDVSLRSTGRALTASLEGRQDSMGVWARHGRHVARAVAELLDRARDQVLDGGATVSVRDRQARLRFTPEVLDALAGQPLALGPGAAHAAAHPAASGWADDLAWRQAVWPEVITLLRSGQQRRSRASGVDTEPAVWRARRMPDAQPWAAGVVTPALVLQRSTVTRSDTALICPVRSAAHGARLAPVAAAARTGEPLLFVGSAPALAPLEASAWTAQVATLDPVEVARAVAGAFVQRGRLAHAA